MYLIEAPSKTEPEEKDKPVPVPNAPLGRPVIDLPSMENFAKIPFYNVARVKSGLRSVLQAFRGVAKNTTSFDLFLLSLKSFLWFLAQSQEEDIDPLEVKTESSSSSESESESEDAKVKIDNLELSKKTALVL